MWLRVLAAFPWMRHLIAVVGVAGLLLTSKTAAASCAPPEPAKQNLQHSDAVFSGEVINAERTVLHAVFGIDYGVTFRVTESWKGVTTTSTTLNNSVDPFMVQSGGEFPFERGQRYLVYARRDANGTLLTNGCIGTRPLSDARMDLFDLGPPTIMLQPGPTQRLTPWTLAITLVLLVLLLVVPLARSYHRHSRQA